MAQLPPGTPRSAYSDIAMEDFKPPLDAAASVSSSNSSSSAQEGTSMLPEARNRSFGQTLKAQFVPENLEPTFLAFSHDANDKDAGSDSIDYGKPLDSYEGAHRYDPSFQWLPEEEKRLVRKVCLRASDRRTHGPTIHQLDYRICAFVCLCFFALQLDRGNIVQALSDNLLDDLNLTTDNYNTGQTIFYVCFLAAELPSQLVSKWIGPDNWIPIQMVTWSVVASCQAFLSGKSSFYATRGLLGALEGGFIPDNVLYLSYFYTGKELPGRLAYFWTAYQATFIIGAFLAYGFLHLRGYHGLAGWRWLFALEGLITGVIGIFTWFYLPPSPTQTKGSIRGKEGWFNEREEKIMVNRILRDDPSKGDMHNRQYLTWGMFRDSLLDYDMWPIYLIGLTWTVPNVPITAYLTLILKSLDFSTFESNLLSIPAYTIFIIGLIFWTWLSERTGERFLLCLVSQIWCLPCLIALEVLPGGDKWARYACSILIVGYPYVHAILVAITSRNAGSVRTRTVSTAIYNMMVQTANIIGINIYRTNDKPLYRTGNKVLLAIVAYNICLFIGAKIYYMTKNARRERVWSRMSKPERDAYLLSGRDKGNKRLDFRFAH